MSTRSRIGMKLPNGKIKSVYCHSDGYISGVGATLREHYLVTAQIKELIALGDLSTLGDGTEHDAGTFAYMRDRSETGCEAKLSKDEHAYMNDGENSGGEYLYLWEGTKWLVCDMHSDEPEWNELTAELVAGEMS